MASPSTSAPDDFNIFYSLHFLSQPKRPLSSETVHLEHLKDSSEESNDETSPSQPYQGLTGLRNLGNTCYMNAVLQCLCSISPLVEYFLSGKYVTSLHKENGEVATAFAYLMADMWLGEFECVSPEVFRSVIGDLCPAFTVKTQQDAQEFLIYVLNELHEALKKSYKRRCYGNTSTSREDRRTGSETSIITQLFEGQLNYDITCLECQTTTDKNEDCLECFFQQDTLTWNNQIHCSFCETKQDAAVKANIGKAPKMVIFHLKRFDCQGSYKRKLGTNIYYPLSNLDLSPYIYPLFRKNPKYNLCAVVNHFGYLDGGHYTAFCKHTLTQNWYSFDDAQVSEIPQSSVQSAAAYLLFYTCKAFSVPTKTTKY
ncbi:ubiquitin carboxyl-terminal hydrolase 50 isoform X3 [Pelodiscus sinensis]|uniref:ubiquitin carboxyl-terminal hydrolase 50 isoform X3 n=1 Tax=Pelodiscus sinensis TaxID=13735 RepID=UPI000D723C60|nr:inactive ubiquitin carboxyl-terminal hydrolase 50 isoform X3 [Pelodiscus sinensis]|eukprot:XP_025035361.1 inactive ubiquitin carboxyl-terminal hydrolase 50 isoform X3 [Pelodiscus sinensis]